MPIMIPDLIPSHATGPEKMIFETFKSVPQRNWEVLHGIKISPRNSSTNPIEIDFVILMPGFVSVICLQVVKDESYKFENGQRSNSGGATSTSPLEQAKKTTQDLREHFKDSHFRDDSALSLGSAVAFTELPQHLNLMTEGSKEPSDVLNPEGLSTILGEYAVDLTKELWEDWEKLTLEDWERRHFRWEDGQVALDKLRSELVSTGGTISTISTIFHDNLETHRPQLLRLTDDQLKVLQRVGCQPPSTIPFESDDQTDESEPVKERPRCVVDGAAGTGKTILAIEIARQRCEEGETVGMLCSNPHLSRRFERWAETLSRDNGGKVVAGTPATLPSWAFRADDVCQKKHQQRLKDSPQLEGSLKIGYLDSGWQDFIDKTIEDLRALGQEHLFDYLIVDEAQNLCDNMFLCLQDALLKNGLKNGNWIMFGDFKNQKIVAPHIKQDGKDALRDFRNLKWKDATLQTNCRNTHEIAEKAAKLVGIPSPTMLGVYGPHVQIEYFEQEENSLEDILDSLIEDWKNRNLQSRQIILLSSGTGNEFDTSREYSGWRLLNIRKMTEDPSSGKNNALRYSDIYDFQGLESDLAILVLPQTEDQVPLAGSLTLPKEKHLNKVLYTGMSRAKVMLIIVADEHWRTTLERREFLYDKRKTLQQTV